MGATLNLNLLKLLNFASISAGCARDLLYSFTLVFPDIRPFSCLNYSHAVPQSPCCTTIFLKDEMGTIIPRKRKSGSTGYHAQLLIKRRGAIVHRESRTFDRKQAAAAWLERRESELAKPGALEREKTPDPTLASVIDRYTEESVKDIGRTKTQVLAAIKRYDIGNQQCSTITSADIIAFANQLVSKVTPQTVANYLSHLAAVFAIARPAWGYQLDQNAMKDAFAVAKRLGITSKSRARDRRPTLDELDKLMTHFGERLKRRPSSVPMQKITAFAIFSTRRLEEITRICWNDLDASRLLIRDMKNPGEKIGNDVWCDLPPEALQIILSMPKTSEEIFPYSTDAIGAGFTRACQFLGIMDLHFHDLRHDGVSRLFETGLSIPQVASVSGHRAWSSLKRYTHLRQTGDKYVNWKWLYVVTS
jgi:integrase